VPFFPVSYAVLLRLRPMFVALFPPPCLLMQTRVVPPLLPFVSLLVSPNNTTAALGSL